MTNESFKAENTDELVWLRLNRLKSIKLCETLLRKKLELNPNPQITEEILKSKCIGLSSAIESAIGYWQVSPQSLNAKILSRYYFLLQMTIAEQVGKTTNTYGLKEVQKHTENGHGLGTITNQNLDFPDNYFTFALRSGHFYSYSKSLGINTKYYDFEKRPRDFSQVAGSNQIVELMDLFRRVPELNNVIEEYSGKQPLCFHVGHSELNMYEKFDAIEQHLVNTGKLLSSVPNLKPQRTTYIDIYPKSSKITPEYLASLNLPLTDFKYRTSTDYEYIVGKLEHPSDKEWHQFLPLYSSSYATTTLVVPLWDKINDNIVINYMLMYTLSIIVRYLPDLWFRINTGNLNHIGSLMEYYVSIMDHVLPLQMLERITQNKIEIHQPGSLFGQI